MTLLSRLAPLRSQLIYVSRGARGLSFDGVLLFAIGLSLLGSGFRAARFEFGGLLVHPYLFVVACVFPLFVVSRLSTLPARYVLGMSLLVAMYFASTLTAGVALGEGLKTAAAVTTIFTVAMLVSSWQDFVAGAVGMCLAIAVLGVRGLDADPTMTHGIEALDAANRNSYSLYALPAILLGSFAILQRQAVSLPLRLILLACVTIASLSICLNVNRSGWACLALVAVMLIRRRGLTGILIAALVGLSVAFIIRSRFDTDHLEHRVQQTMEGTDSDTLRWQLIANSVQIGLENPLMGVSPQELPTLLGRRLHLGHPLVTHNVFAHFIGGSGLICTAVLLWIGMSLWQWKLVPSPPPVVAYRFQESQRLLRMLLVLWAARGMFTHEILYSPAFSIALGMCIGLCQSFTPSLAQVHSIPPSPVRLASRAEHF